MAIPHGALVFVGDGKKMLFLRNQGDSDLLDLRTESHEVRADNGRGGLPPAGRGPLGP